MIQARILIIDDNAAVLQSLRLVLKSSFSTVAAVSEPNLIPAIIKEENIDVVLLDMNFGVGKLDGQEGLFWLDYIKYRGGLANPPAVVLITAFGDVALAVESLKKGADDFIQKPWDNAQLIQKIAEAIEKRREKNSLSDSSLSPHLKDLEREHIRKVLEENGGNVTLAARALDISRQTLYRKMKYYGLS
jgi:DNA-binding NtrC family response regulator